jgi:TRAP-type C4-dicarboxylate transport system permease small subunit
MWLSQAVHSLERVVSLISRAINSVAAGILVAMMLLAAMDVLLRYIFNRPISGSLELTEYMMVIVVAFGLAHCAAQKGHVRVELLLSRLPSRGQAVVNTITYLFSLGLFSLITWQSILYISVIFGTERISAVLHIPAFPFVAMMALGSAMLSLVLLVDFLDYLSQAVKE